MKNILLAYGAGASSGLIAQKTREATQKQGLDIRIRTVSDTETMENVDGVGVLLVGPHLKHKSTEIEEEARDLSMKVVITGWKYYTTLDEGSTLKQALGLVDQREVRVQNGL